MGYHDIELLRAKLAFICRDECPPAVRVQAHQKFPDALKLPWIAQTTADGAAAASTSSSASNISVDSSSSTPASDAAPPPPAPPSTTDGKLRRKAEVDAVTAYNAEMATQDVIHGRQRTLETLESRGIDESICNGTNAAPLVISKSIKRAHDSHAGSSVEKHSKIDTMALDSRDLKSVQPSTQHDDNIDKVRIVQGSSKRLKKESNQRNVTFISDSQDEIEKRATVEEFEPRYVVVDAVGWVFHEVAMRKKAIKRCAQVMPPIDAGNGVSLYINDPAHTSVLHAFRHMDDDLTRWRELTGSSRNRPLIRHQREKLQQWRESRGFVRSLHDTKWDFSPLWYLFRHKVEELKKIDEVIRRSRTRGAGKRGGGMGQGRSDGGDGGTRRVLEARAGAAADAFAGGQREDSGASKTNLVSLLFGDDE